MKIIGFRSGTKGLRFAILEQTSNGIECINLGSENELKIPTNITNIEDQILWINDEVERIFRQNPDIVKVMIKSPEFTPTDTLNKRTTNYFDAVLLLNAKKFDKPVFAKFYSQIGVKRASVKEKVEALYGATSKKWDEQVADAIFIAHFGYK